MINSLQSTQSGAIAERPRRGYRALVSAQHRCRAFETEPFNLATSSLGVQQIESTFGPVQTVQLLTDIQGDVTVDDHMHGLSENRR